MSGSAVALGRTLLVALAQASAPEAAWPPPAEPVLAAAARGVVFQLLTEEVQETGAVACLMVDTGEGPALPSPAFLERFEKVPFVRGGDACEASPEGVFESESGAPGYRITVGPVKWVAADEGHVRVVFRREGTLSRQRLYRVVRDRTGWVSLGQILEMSPA